MSVTKKGGNLTALLAMNSAWGVGAEVIKFNQNISTAITGHEKKKNLKGVITHDKVDEDFTDLLNDYMTVDPEGADTGTYEDGSSRGGVGNNPEDLLLALTYSGKNTATGKRLVRVFPARLTSGGDMTLEDKTLESNAELTGVQAESAIVLPTTIFNTALVTGTFPTQVPASTYGISVWLTGV